MICTCFGKTFDTRVLEDAARAVMGVPAYEVYLAHATASHPDREQLSREAFFANRQKARFGGSGLRCC